MAFKWLYNCTGYYMRYHLWYRLLHIYGQISHLLWCRTLVSDFLLLPSSFMTFSCQAAVSSFYSHMKHFMKSFLLSSKKKHFFLTDLFLVFRLHENHLLVLSYLSFWFVSTLKKPKNINGILYKHFNCKCQSFQNTAI